MPAAAQGKANLAGRKSWCDSNVPEFAFTAAEVIGVHSPPAENAILTCVGEKPSIQALQQGPGYLQSFNGRTLMGHNHHSTRTDTPMLFAVFEAVTDKVMAAHKTCRRRVEFHDVMNEVVATCPGKDIHVVLDNFNTQAEG